jgi:hypothetical protein
MEFDTFADPSMYTFNPNNITSSPVITGGPYEEYTPLVVRCRRQKRHMGLAVEPIMIAVDPGMADILARLNEIHFFTKNSCQGHALNDTYSCPYIQFMFDMPYTIYHSLKEVCKSNWVDREGKEYTTSPLEVEISNTHGDPDAGEDWSQVILRIDERFDHYAHSTVLDPTNAPLEPFYDVCNYLERRVMVNSTYEHGFSEFCASKYGHTLFEAYEYIEMGWHRERLAVHDVKKSGPIKDLLS